MDGTKWWQEWKENWQWTKTRSMFRRQVWPWAKRTKWGWKGYPATTLPGIQNQNHPKQQPKIALETTVHFLCQSCNSLSQLPLLSHYLGMKVPFLSPTPDNLSVYLWKSQSILFQFKLYGWGYRSYSYLNRGRKWVG